MFLILGSFLHGAWLVPAGASTPTCGGEKATIVGTGGNNRLEGTAGDDVIAGKGGSDLIRGRGGNDIICGGTGGDDLRGGGGKDQLLGGRGKDRADGGAGTDTCTAEVVVSCNEGGGGNVPPSDISLTNGSVKENEPSGTVVGTLSATDPDAGQSHSFALVDGDGSADNPSFAIVGVELRTAEVFDFETKGTYSIRVRATDDGAPSEAREEQLTVTVTDVNEAPAVTTTSSTLEYYYGSGPVAVDPDITVSDPDPTLLSGATVQITANFSSAEDQLAFTDQSGITGSYDAAAGTLTLTGQAAVADYQTALASVTYNNSASEPSTATRTVTFSVTDAEGATSAPATRDINVHGYNWNWCPITTPGCPGYVPPP